MKRFVEVVCLFTLVLLCFCCLTKSAAEAQAPSPTPPARHAVIGVAVNPPPGWDPAVWARLRAQCQSVADKPLNGQKLTRADDAVLGGCRNLAAIRVNPNFSGGGRSTLRAQPTPTPTAPSPVSGLAPAPSQPSYVGPFGVATATITGDAILQTQPPDVAADVSPTEMVEFTNFGLQVWDKPTVTAKFSSPVDLFDFWCQGGTNGGTISCSTTPPKLTDTQIAWDAPAQRWLATTAYDDTGNNEGDILFAVSQTSDAAGHWNTYRISNACSSIAGSTNWFVDQPILGYNGYWIAIEARCYQGQSGPRYLSDALIIVANDPIPNTISATPIVSPVLDAAPSKDVKATSSSTYSDLFLVGDAGENPGGPNLVLAALDQSGNITTLDPSPSVGDVASSTQVPPVSCGAGCTIALGQSRIASAILQTANDGYHYLMTTYEAEDGAQSNGEVMYYVARAETLRGSSAIWNTWWIGGWPSSNGSASYPAITSDDDLDFVYSFQTFQGGSSQTPYSNWYAAKGFTTSLPGIQSPPLMGYGINYDQESSGSYTGNGSGQQRWGDYMSMVWDSSYSDASYASPSGENSAFWSVAEVTSGGSNQTTNWVSLNDPLPFFAGYTVPYAPNGTYGENECGVANTHCKLNFTAPTNAQPGDLLVVEIAIGESTDINHLTLPPGWVALPMTNHGDQYGLLSWDSTGYLTSFVAAYVYGSQSNDSGSYQFIFQTKTSTSETDGLLLSYRGATMSPQNVVSYGYGAAGDASSRSTGSVTPATQSTLVSLFVDSCLKEGQEGTGNEQNAQFTAPSGTPTVTPETALASNFPELVADVGVPVSSSSYGPYTTNTCYGILWAYLLEVPEL